MPMEIRREEKILLKKTGRQRRERRETSRLSKIRSMEGQGQILSYLRVRACEFGWVLGRSGSHH